MALGALHSSNGNRSTGLHFGERNSFGKASSSQFQNHQILARIVDQWLASQGVSSQPVQRALNKSDISTLKEALQSLPPQHSDSLSKLLGEDDQQVILARISQVAQTSQSSQFATSLFEFGEELEEMGQEPLATAVYSVFSSRDKKSETYLISGATAELRERARTRANLLQGQGDVAWGDFFAFQAKQVGKSLKDPAMVVGLAAGTTVLAKSRSWLLPKFLNSRSAFLGSVPFVSRSAASALATVPETTALWASSKGINELLHPGVQAWDLATNLRELGTLGISLGVMKPTGFMVGRTGMAIQTSRTLPQAFKAMLPKNPMLWNQLGMYSGLALSHGVEMDLGLRPQQSLSFLLAGSASFWLQLQVGASLSRLSFPGLHSYQGRLYQKMAAVEQGQINVMASRLRQLAFQGPELNSLRRPALVQGLSEALQVDPLAPARQQNILMAADGRGTPQSPPPSSPLSMGQDAPFTSANGVSSLVRQMFGNSSLPIRDGSPGAPLERISSKEGPFPQEMMVNLSRPVRRIMLEYLGVQQEPGATQVLGKYPSRNRLAKQLLGDISNEDFGFSVGLALQEGMREFLNIGNIEEYKLLNPRDMEAADLARAQMLDELVGVTEFAARAGQRKVLNNIAMALNVDLSSRLFGIKYAPQYPLLKQGLINLFGQGPAMLSIGAGEMGLAMLHLRRHVIRPGGDTWRSPLYVLPRRAEVAQAINEQGFVPKEVGCMGPEMRFNFLGDPQIVAVGPKGYQGPSQSQFGHLTQADLMSNVRFQWLNVPSRALAGVLTPEYIENLPQNARLIHVIKGLIQPEAGSIYVSRSGEQPTLLPHELLARALGYGLASPEGAKYRVFREDVEVVSGAGFTPGRGVVHLDPLASGESIRMAFSGRETQEGSRFAAAAMEVGQLMAGQGLNNPYLDVTVNHWQFSNEMGGAMKNVVSLLAGQYGVRIARKLLNEGIHELEGPKAQEIVQAEVLPKLRTILERMLINEGIPAKKVDFNDAVMEDFERCCSVYLQNILGLVKLARSEGIPIHDRDALNQWMDNHLVQKRRNFAATRNSAVGVAAGLIEMWQQEKGVQLNPKDFKLKLTKEGVDSLPGLIDRNNYTKHPVEKRFLHREVYDLHDFFNPESPANRPLRIPRTLIPVVQSQPRVRAAVTEAAEAGAEHRIARANRAITQVDATGNGIVDGETLVDLLGPAENSGLLEVPNFGDEGRVTMVDLDGPNSPHTTQPDLGPEALDGLPERGPMPELPSEAETWIVPVDLD